MDTNFNLEALKNILGLLIEPSEEEKEKISAYFDKYKTNFFDNLQSMDLSPVTLEKLEAIRFFIDFKGKPS